MEHILDITSPGAALRLSNGSLSIQRRDGGGDCVPLRDIAVLLLSEGGVSLSAALIGELSSQGAATVFCDRRHVPVAIVQPLCAHSLQERILAGQVAAGPSLRKRLWQELVRKKIEHQSDTLAGLGHRHDDLDTFARRVRSGDVENAEGMAARIFWKRLGLFPNRDREADDANRLLNYAYAIVFGTAARALCATGLHPSLGLHHHNQYNAFCLASDVMEPFRVAADLAVLKWLRGHPDVTEPVPEAKRFLVQEITTTRFDIDGLSFGLFPALTYAATSLRDSLVEQQMALRLPVCRVKGLPLCG